MLCSDDTALARMVRQLVANVESCQFVKTNLAVASRHFQHDPPAAALLHFARADQEANIHRLLETATAAGVPTVIICDDDDPAPLVRMLRLGAVDCLRRPLNITRLETLVDILTLRARHSAPAQSAVRRNAANGEEHDGLLLVSGRMRSLADQLKKVASLDSTILLTGETGSGKTCLARWIHGISARSAEPFVVVNCAALSPTLLESEMFGHVRGAFTGAESNREGKLAWAGKGTLLLDEIDSLPLTIQGKLLRVVEDRVFEPVGSNETQSMQARLIVASNRSLDEEVSSGRFRADLYFRLNVLGFHLPPLRERREAIPRLVDKYLAEFYSHHNGRVTGVTADAHAALTAYSWPGNVRELRNLVERTVSIGSGSMIELDDLPQAIQDSALQCLAGSARMDSPRNELAAARRHAERKHLADALQRNNNNRSHAALELGISRVTLYKKLHRHGLS
jgi:two-component system, NtrC family, response regulator HydG